MTTDVDLVGLDAFGPNGRYQSRNRLTITDVAANPVAELSLVPKLFVARAMGALQKAHAMPLDRRLAALGEAGTAFATETIDGMSVADYEHLVCRVSGLPISVVRFATQRIARHAAENYEHSVSHARPAGAAVDWRDPATRTGSAVWTRRGNVFAVHTPGNHPAVQAVWMEALALGYRVAVRPSQREPFTANRLASALRSAGFGDDQLVLLPTDYECADEIVRGADLAMAYGGEDVMRKYATWSSMLPQGPGRSKILVTADVDWREHIDMIVDSISHGGGTACVNTTAVFVEGDPSLIAEAIAEQLSVLPSLPPEDESAVLPVQPLASARRVEGYLLAKAAGTVAWLGGDGIVDELGDGSAVLRPAVHELDRPEADQARVELSFPCVWVVPWTRELGSAPLRDTLVLTALTDDERLLDELIGDPTISNVYIGDHPTYWREPRMPHDGYLADFLMRTKSVVRD